MSEPIVVSYSELDTYRQCPLKHHLAYKKRYRKPSEAGKALARGTLWHQVLQAHYEAIRAHQPPYTAVKPLLSDPTTGERTPDQELIWWMYQGYRKFYRSDRQWEILAIEEPFEVTLSPATDTTPEIRIKGKMDLLVRDSDGRVWVVDHKSGYELPSTQVLDIDDQFGLYLAAMSRLGIEAYGAIHSAARTRRLKGDEDGSNPTELEKRFMRTPMHRLKVELENIWEDARRVAVAAYQSSDPPYSSPNPTTCQWKCDFLEPHMLMRKGVRPSVALRSFGLVQDFTRH